LQLLEHLDLSHTWWQPQTTGSAWPVSWGNMTSLHYLDLSASNYTTVITGGRLVVQGSFFQQSLDASIVAAQPWHEA
jgi:hypothetical protein